MSGGEQTRPVLVGERLPNWELAEQVRRVRGLTQLQHRVLSELAWEADLATSQVSPGVEGSGGLVERLDSGAGVVNNALSALHKKGLITHVRRARRGSTGRPGQSAVYQVVLPAELARPRSGSPAASGSSSTVTGARRRLAGASSSGGVQPPLMTTVTSSQGEVTGLRPGWSVVTSSEDEVTVVDGGITSLDDDVIVDEHGTTSSTDEVIGLGPAAGPPLGPMTSLSGEAIDRVTSSSDEAPPNWVGGVVLWDTPQSPPTAAAAASSERGSAGGSEATAALVEIALGAFTAEQRRTVTVASRRSLAKAAAPLVGLWTPAQLRERLETEPRDKAQQLGGWLTKKLRDYATESGPLELARREQQRQVEARTAAAEERRRAEERNLAARQQLAARFAAEPELLAAIVAAIPLRDRRGRAGQRLLGHVLVHLEQITAHPGGWREVLPAPDPAVVEVARATTDLGLLEHLEAVRAALAAVPGAPGGDPDPAIGNAAAGGAARQRVGGGVR